MACWCAQSLSKLVYSCHLPPLCLHSSSYGARFVLKALCGNLLFLLREWLWVGQRWEARVQESCPLGCVCVCGGEPPCQDSRGPWGTCPPQGKRGNSRGFPSVPPTCLGPGPTPHSSSFPADPWPDALAFPIFNSTCI